MNTTMQEKIDTLLEQWSPYFTNNDLNILKVFGYNIANGIPNNKLLIFRGPGATGKSTLARQLMDLFGNSSSVNGVITRKRNNTNMYYHCCCFKKILLYNYGDDIDEEYIEKVITRAPIVCKELYQEPKEHCSTSSIIMILLNYDVINQNILMNSDVINFTHIF